MTKQKEVILLFSNCETKFGPTLLYVPLQKAAERGGYGGERYERLDFQKKVEEKYQALRDPSWKVPPPLFSFLYVILPFVT